MGTWGTGIRDDDLVADMLSAFDEHLKEGASVAEATQKVLAQFDSSQDDPDEAHLLWLALADAQWTYGELQPEILARARADVAAGAGLGLWNGEDLPQRLQVLNRFLEKLATPNPRPRKRPKRIVRKPFFAAGDCLAVRLPNGPYGAALVLAADHSRPEYGMNLIGVLDYMEPEKPALDIFARRAWLRLTHHKWNGHRDLSWYLPLGFRKVKDRIEVVGTVPLLPSDPQESNTYSGWILLCGQIEHQREWDRNHSRR